MLTLLNHIFADLCGVSENLLKNKGQLISILERAAKKGEFTILAKSAHKFTGGGEGVSVTLILGESHASLHTWPEYNYAAADIASCKGRKSAFVVMKSIIRSLSPKSYDLKIIKRPLQKLAKSIDKS